MKIETPQETRRTFLTRTSCGLGITEWGPQLPAAMRCWWTSNRLLQVHLIRNGRSNHNMKTVIDEYQAAAVTTLLTTVTDEYC